MTLSSVLCGNNDESIAETKFSTTQFYLSVQVASFPFRKSMSLLVVMPMSGQLNVSSLIAKLNISDLYSRLPKARAVQVKVPKFKLEYAQDLKDVFTKLGKTSLYPMDNV